MTTCSVQEWEDDRKYIQYPNPARIFVRGGGGLKIISVGMYSMSNSLLCTQGIWNITVFRCKNYCFLSERNKLYLLVDHCLRTSFRRSQKKFSLLTLCKTFSLLSVKNISQIKSSYKVSRVERLYIALIDIKPAMWDSNPQPCMEQSLCPQSHFRKLYSKLSLCLSAF